jgi:ribose 5-phosphate isomerase B
MVLDTTRPPPYPSQMRVRSSRVQTTPTTTTVVRSTTAVPATMLPASTASPTNTSQTPKDGVDAVVVAGNANSTNRSSGAGLTQKLVDPKRAVALDATVGQLLAFTPEELAFARKNPVVVSADHNGAPLAAKLTAFLKAQGIPVTDVAAPMAAAAKGEKFPYAQAALPALVGLSNGTAARVILICGNGIGMRDVAKQWPGATVCYGEILHEVRSSRKAEDSNVLALGARLLGGDVDLAKLFVKTFVATAHQGMPERYQSQTDQIALWAALAAKKGASLSLDDFGDAIPKGAGSTEAVEATNCVRRGTGTALPLREVMLRRHTEKPGDGP